MHRTLLSFGVALTMIASQHLSAASNDSQQQQQHQISQSDKSSSQSARSDLSNDVDQMLNCTNQASQALQAQNKDKALKHINDALDSLNKVDQSGSNQRYVPLYTELDRYSVLAPIMASRNQQGAAASGNSATANADNTSSASKSNPNEGSNGSASPAQQQAHPTVANVTGQFTSVLVDTQTAKNNLQSAKQALQQGNTNSARQALLRVQDSVIVTSFAADLPLLRARENLVLARAAASSGDYQEAQAALKSAGKALGNYASVSSNHSSDAKDLESQIQSYQVASNKSDASSKINSWWSETASWMKSSQQNQQATNTNEANSSGQNHTALASNGNNNSGNQETASSTDTSGQSSQAADSATSGSSSHAGTAGNTKSSAASSGTNSNGSGSGQPASGNSGRSGTTASGSNTATTSSGTSTQH